MRRIIYLVAGRSFKWYGDAHDGGSRHRRSWKRTFGLSGGSQRLVDVGCDKHWELCVVIDAEERGAK